MHEEMISHEHRVPLADRQVDRADVVTDTEEILLGPNSAEGVNPQRRLRGRRNCRGQSRERRRHRVFASTTVRHSQTLEGVIQVSLIRVAIEPTESAFVSRDYGNPSTQEQLAAFFAAYVKWIPTEVVVVFGAWVTANWAHQQTLFDQARDAVPPVPPPTTEPKIWWLCLALSVVMVPILVWVASHPADKLVRKTVLAGIGFVIWSASITHSFSWSWIKPADLEWVWFGPAVVILGGLVAKIGETVSGLPTMSGWKRIL
jgi:hypothetical protein